MKGGVTMSMLALGFTIISGICFASGIAILMGGKG